MKYQIQIQESGSGRIFNLTEELVTLEKANELVKEYDLRWDEWAEHGFPELVNPDDPIGSWEGCDVTAVGEDGKTFLILDEENWEEL